MRDTNSQVTLASLLESVDAWTILFAGTVKKDTRLPLRGGREGGRGRGGGEGGEREGGRNNKFHLLWIFHRSL